MTKAASLLAAIFVLGTAAMPAAGQTLIRHFSNETIGKIASRFSKAVHDGGIAGLTADIQDCYRATTLKRTAANGESIAACMLYDYSAVEFDKAARQSFVAQGMNDPGPTTDYLSDKAIAARFSIYESIPFGNDPAAVLTYFGDAPRRVLKEMKF